MLDKGVTIFRICQGEDSLDIDDELGKGIGEVKG